MMRKPMRAASVALGLAAVPATAQECRQALVLGLDASLSVNTIDFTLQRDGLAQALTDAAVVAAMVQPGAAHVELAVFEWSGQYDQTVLIDWTVIDGARTLDRIARTLTGTRQNERSGRTALGAAMLYARDMLATRGHCAVHTLDISGDGFNNNGILPETVRGVMAHAGIGVNGLVIEPDAPGASGQPTALTQYFRDRVIVGTGAFVETIAGFQHYEEAIRRKLLRELTPAFVQDRRHAPHRIAGAE